MSPFFGPTGEVSDILTITFKGVAEIQRQPHQASNKKQAIELDHVSEFWEVKGGAWSSGRHLAITGQLSPYAPLLVGAPKRKREFHRNLRLAIPDFKEKAGQTFIDALLAYSAGQLVVRLDPESTPLVYMGLYHSIVRNSIPLFVDRDYYQAQIKPLFSGPRAPQVIEARVQGTVRPMDIGFIKEYIEHSGAKDLFNFGTLDPAYALQIDGESNGTGVEKLAESRYLDGDIWVAIRPKTGAERWVTRFIDLSDPMDVANEHDALKDDVTEYYPESTLLAEFDQLHRAFSGYQSVDPNDIIRGLKDN